MRGDGKTTRQIESAQHGAVFIWVSSDTHYPKILAEKLGRPDIEIVGPEWLYNGWRGRTLSGVVLDHAASMTDEQYYLYKLVHQRVLMTTDDLIR